MLVLDLGCALVLDFALVLVLDFTLDFTLVPTHVDARERGAKPRL